MPHDEVPASRVAAYLNARVTVHYTQTYTDTGVLTHMDAVWVEITKDNGERLLIPHASIRLIKLLEPGAPSDDSAILLRAAGALADPSESKRGRR